jgi:hypothetical protein
VDPGSREPGTAYFGVALTSDYMRRNYEAHRSARGTDLFRQLLPRNDSAVVNPPVTAEPVPLIAVSRSGVSTTHADAAFTPADLIEAW